MKECTRIQKMSILIGREIKQGRRWSWLRSVARLCMRLNIQTYASTESERTYILTVISMQIRPSSRCYCCCCHFLPPPAPILLLLSEFPGCWPRWDLSHQGWSTRWRCRRMWDRMKRKMSRRWNKKRMWRKKKRDKMKSNRNLMSKNRT